MKTIKTLLLAFLLLSSLLYSQTNTFKLGFTGAYPNYYTQPTYDVNWSWYNELNMNIWSGWWVGDTAVTVFDNLSSSGINGYLQPDTLRWAALGRSQVNEAEETSNRFRYNGHRCGQDITDNSQWGSGEIVRYYNKNSLCNEESPQGLILWSVNENGFQTIANYGYDPMYQIPFPTNGNNGNPYLNRYYIKPRMRISVDDAFSNPPQNVCKIIVKDFSGNAVSEFIITTQEFRYTNSSTYDGRYLEEYFDLPISVTGNALNTGRPSFHPINLNNCQVDYQIYWYGEVSVWIDYVKVMDEAAQTLFGNRNQDKAIRLALKNKMIRLNSHENTYGEFVKGFYTEEFDYSCIPTMKMLNDSLPVWADNDPDYKMIGLINWISFRAPLKQGLATDYEDYIDAVHPPVLMYVSYPFEGPYGPHPPKLPSNVSYYFQSYYPSIIGTQITYAYDDMKDNYTNYNNYLQSECWDFYYKRFDTINNLCRTKGIDFHQVPQVHTWKDGNNSWQSHREPMNSEIETELSLGICHGVKGILPYAYESWYYYNSPAPRGGNGVIEEYADSDPDGHWYSFGMTDFKSIQNPYYWGEYKRVTNFYGEPKWDHVKNLYGKIKIWGPVIANSTNTSGFSVHDGGANHNYICDIASIDPHKTGLNPCDEDSISDGLGGYLWADCDDEKYWEMGFFTSTERNTKYFMMVNRRCVPEGGGFNGDDRVLRIKFNPTNLPEAVNWKIYDAANPDIEPVTFSKNYQGYVDIGSGTNGLGWFEPGEGKLFKLVPVYQTGGTLVADEYIPAGSPFTCQDTVWTNGYDLTIEDGVTINFSDSAKFIVHGGTFQMGNAQHSGPNTINIDASSGNSWKGFEFDTCNVKIYGVNFSELANDSISMLTMINCPLIDLRDNTFTLGFILQF